MTNKTLAKRIKSATTLGEVSDIYAELTTKQSDTLHKALSTTKEYFGITLRDQMWLNLLTRS